MFQEIKPCKNCCWVKFKLPYNASVLLIDSDLLSICGIRWTPEKSGFQVARCIAVHSNNFLYDMKANWYPKKRFRAETKRCFFGGALSCFRGTATYVDEICSIGLAEFYQIFMTRSSWIVWTNTSSQSIHQKKCIETNFIWIYRHFVNLTSLWVFDDIIYCWLVRCKISGWHYGAGG